MIAEKCLETLALNTVPKRAAFSNPNPNCRLSPRQGPQSWLRQNSSHSTELFAISTCSLQTVFCFGSPLPVLPSCRSAFSLPFKPNPYRGTQLSLRKVIAQMKKGLKAACPQTCALAPGSKPAVLRCSSLTRGPMRCVF